MKKIIFHFKENWIRHGFETLVVVVGVIIAFGLNDWNESSKARIAEIGILNELISSLEADSSALSINIAFHNQAIKSSEIILTVLDSKGAFNDSLSRHFASINNYTTFASALGPYESLKSMGFETISNKSLRLEIISLYDQQYMILKNNERILTEDIQELKRHYYQDHFEEFQVIIPDPPYYAGKMVPNNFNELMLNKSFRYFVRTLINDHASFNLLNKMNVERVNELKRKCQEEIIRLK
ncbi:DUF6090 family protein [Algoriphagus sp. SE2]|uniref:DUF6090 family protein n=1 Tax=Algoriphagus sp. SE2 TaxID=3141536 RepID=UPI0031CD8ED1